MRKILDVTQGVVVERVGSELLVVVPGSLDTLKFSGEAAQTLRDIQARNPVDVRSPTVADLIDLGVVKGQRQMSRRGFIRVGAIGAGAGIAVLSMPGAAAASSPVYLEFIFYQTEFGSSPTFAGSSDHVRQLTWPYVGGNNIPPNPEPTTGTEATLRVGTHVSTWTYFESGGGQAFWQYLSGPRITRAGLNGSTLTYTFNGVTYIATYDDEST